MASKSKTLFKDRVNDSNYLKMIDELEQAISNGNEALKQLLFDSVEPDLYINHGSYKAGQHNRCGGFDNKAFWEKRLCKCLYYMNSKYRIANECEKCQFPERYAITGSYKITDYEVPAYYYGSNIGKIDLILNDIYATEVKPDKNNEESLLRMVAEIMTYTLGFPKGQYKNAIGFFENTPQEEEYLLRDPSMMRLLEKAEITVFCFKKKDKSTIEIFKL